MPYRLPIGANTTLGGTHFRVWAQSASRVELVLYQEASPAAAHAMQPEGEGYYTLTLAEAGPGTRYMYRLNGQDDRPDPASRFQPLGVHGPSQVVDPSAFSWNDPGWQGITIEDATIYELHIGTFTPEGTFDAAIARLDQVVDLGVSAIQLMPVADFPGERNWGYDGVCLFAPSRAYGGPEGLRRLVDAAHQKGLAVILDVVYNHLGPDGNYLRQFSQHYFTDHHTTPWGDALNFDDLGSQHVRAFFIGNASYWAHEYHLDGLRLDATHAIKDDSQPHILAELAASVRASLPAGRQFLLIAEDERNEPMLVRPAVGTVGAHRDVPLPSQPGYGLDAIWADDFHHQLRVALTGEREAYYADYTGTAEDIVRTLEQGWFYTGQESPTLGHARGQPADDLPATAFLHCLSNHDQVGNRALGDRLNAVIGLDAYRAATVLLLCSPYLPMLFQGQEWAASTPFQFFTDHNADLGRLITEGRRREFAKFTAFAGETVPDPQAEATFTHSKLNWIEREQPPHAGVLQLHRDLLRLRRELPALRERGRDCFAAVALGQDAIALRRQGECEMLLLVVNLRGAHRHELNHTITARPPGEAWHQLLSSEDPRYGGSGGARLEGGTAVFEGPGALLLRL
ncbi:MAG: malto-oligosyltrehalose trehalohydrolase [Roseiflexaceae bacterium]|nr:malto-oligosyltrehalose trehalohydrolase [Roseiflexaceae bacterium]